MGYQRTHITAGSFTRLSNYEQCPRKAQLSYVDRIPEPDRGEPHARCPVNPATNKREWHNDRGTRIHENADQYIRGMSNKLCVELEAFKHELKDMRKHYKDGLVYTEQMWCFKDDWTPTHGRDWDGIWMRVKLDAFYAMEGTRDEPAVALAADVKTGKRWGNEVKHAEQMQLYPIAAFMKYPTLTKVHAELWYTDQDHVESQIYTRPQAMRLVKNWNKRMNVMISDVVFKPRANIESCKYCPYKREEHGGTGHCDLSVI